MIDYVIKIIMLQVLFLLLYDLFLSKETFFQKNRIYLLVTFLLTFLLPVIKLSWFQKVFSDETSILLSEIVLSPKEVLEQTFILTPQENILPYGIILFWAGVLVFLILFLIKVVRIHALITKNHVEQKEQYSLVTIPNTSNAFSFFRYIFLGDKINSDERRDIISHELIHMKQKHSLDLMLFEVFKIIMWFNPFIYLYQKRISLLHEYLSDSAMIKSLQRDTYINKLLSDLFDVEKFSFVNQFYKHSFIKKRIIMIKKMKSNPVRQLKYLLILPLFICALFYNATTVDRTNKDLEKENKVLISKNTLLKNADTIKELSNAVPFAIIEKVPVFPGCEEVETEGKRRQCFSKKTQQHFVSNFDSSLPNKLKLAPGKKRMVMNFKVDKKGNVTEVEVRGPHPELEKEALRILKLLPKMKPGKQRGKNVAVRYTLPMRIDVAGDKRKTR